jgi:hypothetical protein
VLATLVFLKWDFVESCFQIKSRFEATIEKRDCTREGQMSLKRELFLWKTFAGAA